MDIPTLMDLEVLKEITANFTSELELSSKGQKTSLAFIKNTIPSFPLVQKGEVFQVMVIGGTKFAKALIKKTDDHVEIVSITRSNLPIFSTRELFFSFLESQLDPNISVLSINFGYAIMPLFNNGKLEAIFLVSSKEHAFGDLVGTNICSEFEDYILEKTYRKIHVSMANDTICLLLSGLTEGKSTNLAAGIVGSGVNFAFFLDHTTLINAEAAGFDKFPQTPIGQKADSNSLHKGIHLFEKEISGGFLYQHFNYLFRKRGLAFSPLTDSFQLTTLAKERTDEIGDLAREVLDRSAQLVGSVISGITNFKQADMTFIMQGSVYWDGYNYKETVEKTVKQLTPYHVKYEKIEHADILGAAKLVA